MNRTELPISTLPAWMRLNDASFYNVNVKHTEDKGYALTAEKDVNSENTHDQPILLHVPQDLVLSGTAIEEHAKSDKDFRELLVAAGGKSTRLNSMLFLLMQVTSGSSNAIVGTSNPWTEYVKMLPGSIPVPTLWPEEGRDMLVGTSLELALEAKMSALLAEFETICEKEISWLKDGLFTLADWSLLDAWYRSRSLELPQAGVCMVPCLDMANHSCNANAYYEQNDSGDVLLQLRPSQKISAGTEVTISYGDEKSAAEMLFSYGFIDVATTETKSLLLDMQPMPEDPLGKAKLVAFNGPPTLKVEVQNGRVSWESPVVYLLCLNEEDGLEFKLLQETDGSASKLEVFWQGVNVTDSTNDFPSLIGQYRLADVLRLRSVAMIQDRIQQQLERLYASEDFVNDLANSGTVNKSCVEMGQRLRSMETLLLENSYNALEEQKSGLLQSEVVLQYLGSMDKPSGEKPSGEQPSDEGTNEEDFS